MLASRKAGKSIIYIHIYNEINIASAVFNSSPAVLAYFSSLFKLPPNYCTVIVKQVTFLGDCNHLAFLDLF